MKNVLLRVCLVTILFPLASSIAFAQEMVHAVSGTVISINPKIEMIEINTDDGSSGHFRWLKKSGTSIDFDKSVSEDAIPADKFTTTGTHVIVYYFGDGDVRTAIALKDIGAGSIQKATGTVIKLNKHEHLLTIKASSGAEVSFRLDPKTVTDTMTGVMEGFKFDLGKGDQVRVTAAQASGGATALLIVPAV